MSELGIVHSFCRGAKSGAADITDIYIHSIACVHTYIHTYIHTHAIHRSHLTRNNIGVCLRSSLPPICSVHMTSMTSMLLSQQCHVQTYLHTDIALQYSCHNPVFIQLWLVGMWITTFCKCEDIGKPNDRGRLIQTRNGRNESGTRRWHTGGENCGNGGVMQEVKKK